MSDWHVGVTASRTPRPQVQLHTVDRLYLWLWKNGYTDHHDGDCKNGDAQAWSLATQYFRTIGHPPDDPKHRAFLTHAEERPEKPYIERNHDIVDESHYLVAMPPNYEDIVRSGTWATIRYARKIERPGAIVYPDGSATTLTGERFG